MQASELLGAIEEQNVLDRTESGEYRLTEEMQTAIERTRSELQEYVNTDAGYSLNGKEVAISEDNIDFYANYTVLERQFDFSATDNVSKISLILSWFQRGMPETEGTPEPSLPIHGDQLPVILETFSPAIVYVWRHNCDPCDIVKTDLEELFEDEQQNDLGLFSIYGPAYSQYLREAYNIVGGPTVVFIANGDIDTRLQGAHEQELIRRELETVQSRDG